MTSRECIEVILALSILLGPIALLIHRTFAKKTDGSHYGLGARMVQLVGAMTLLPAIIILALENLIDGATVAALIGAFVGYTFSGLADFDRRTPGKWRIRPRASWTTQNPSPSGEG